ncbi:MAG: nucleotide exchange factor GrpE [candidate division Zixibacteria bacterium]|nr:nucleotide exchange factor GrpE [candidate division Zixibacteria bacterium]
MFKDKADDDDTRRTVDGGAEENEQVGDAETPVVAAAEEKPPKPEETESDRYLRLAADFDNYRKRTAREYNEIVRTANARLLQSLVAVVDDFERALFDEAAREEVDAYRRGIELIYNKLRDLLKRERVAVMDVLGKPFDPEYHEAMMQQPSDEYPDGIICGIVQKGYLLDDKVLRHARVIVSSGPDAVDGEKNETI